MEQVYLDIDGYWGIVVCFNFGKYDKNDLWAYMRSFGLSRANANKALDVLSNYNTGVAISNDDVRMSVIFISKATTPSEFWSTAIHEAKHCADAIIEYYGAKWHGEDEAYLTGYITKLMVDKIGEPCK